MNTKKKKIKYPENLPLTGLIKKSGKSISFLAKQIPVSRQILSDTVHGHYKGTNIVPKLLELLNQ